MNHSAATTHHVRILTDYDVVTLRQHVRQMARSAELSLSQQARITAAVSEVARMALDQVWNAEFTLHLAAHGAVQELEVVCSTSQMRAADGDLNHLQKDVRALVDESVFSIEGNIAQLILRIHP